MPLLSLVDLADVWLRFDLREDLVKGLKVGDRFEVRVPALGDKPITVAVRNIAPRGEYAGWRATRATGDFDLRTFEVRAYPVEPRAGPAAGHERLRRLEEAALMAARSAGRHPRRRRVARARLAARATGVALGLVLGDPAARLRRCCRSPSATP